MLHLFHTEACPHAQRIAIVMHEKFQTFEQTVVDPAAPPPGLDALNPDGTLPALVHEGRVVTDSWIVMEYLDEVFPAPPLLPADPWERARARAWVRLIDRDFNAAFDALLTGVQGPRAETLRMAFRLGMMRLSGLLEEHGGPFFFGTHFGLVDIALLPWFERYPAIAEYARCPIPDEEDYEALRAWVEAASARPAFLETRRDGYDWAAHYQRAHAASDLPRGAFQVEPGEAPRPSDARPELRVVPEPEPVPVPEPEAAPVNASEPTPAEPEAEKASETASETTPNPNPNPAPESKAAHKPANAWPESWPDTRPRTVNTTFVAVTHEDDDDDDLPPIDPDLAYLASLEDEDTGDDDDDDAVDDTATPGSFDEGAHQGYETVEITCRRWPSNEEVFAYFDAIPGVVEIILDPPERKVIVRFYTDETSAETIWGHIEFEPELEPELMV